MARRAIDRMAMEPDTVDFMERLIRDRVVVPLDPDAPDLPEPQRRAWWEFCLEMHEFLGNLIRGQVVTCDEAHELARLQYLCLKGSYVLASADPALKGEQKRYVELCVIAFGVLFPWIVDPNEIFETSDGKAAWNEVFGSYRLWWWDKQPKEPDEAVALLEAWRQRKSNWETARSPVAYLRSVAQIIHAKTCPGLMEEQADVRRRMDAQPEVLRLDALSPTNDPFAALVSDPRSEYPALDLDIACAREGLTAETHLLARARGDGLRKSFAAEVLGIPEETIAKAYRELLTAMPAIRARLKPYLDASRPVFRHGKTR